ncbi:MAG: hypothetical protein ACREV4_05685 [Gammaproteobacteria bacterium]
MAEGEMELLEHRRVTASPRSWPAAHPASLLKSRPSRIEAAHPFCPADSREGYFEGLAELARDGRPERWLPAEDGHGRRASVTIGEPFRLAERQRFLKAIPGGFGSGYGG